MFLFFTDDGSRDGDKLTSRKCYLSTPPKVTLEKAEL